MKAWYAVSGRGQGNIFTSYPVRDEHFKIWRGRIEGCVATLTCLMAAEGEVSLPPITWADEPVGLELSIKVMKEGMESCEK